jgi:hypothetical protein
MLTERPDQASAHSCHPQRSTRATAVRNASARSNQDQRPQSGIASVRPAAAARPTACLERERIVLAVDDQERPAVARQAALQRPSLEVLVDRCDDLQEEAAVIHAVQCGCADSVCAGQTSANNSITSSSVRSPAIARTGPDLGPAEGEPEVSGG